MVLTASLNVMMSRTDQEGVSSISALYQAEVQL